MNYAGERTKLPARVGDSLLSVASRYRYAFVDGETGAAGRGGVASAGLGGMTAERQRGRSAPAHPAAPTPHPTPPPTPGACHAGGTPVDVLHGGAKGNWYEPKYGEGAGCFHCHVILPKDAAARVPPKRPDEAERLQEYPFPEDITET